jgi:aminoglycoside phosphotransferase (APT) family kinase protein
MTEAPQSPNEHGFDEATLHRWLTQNVEGFVGPMTVSKFPGGQSNPTYSIATPGRRYVMRAKPGPAAKLLPSAHAVEREYTVMQALHGSGVPVARMLALCSDEAVIGRVFFVMEHVEGRVLWDPALPGMAPAERTAHYAEMNRVIAALHRVPFAERGLAGYGKPGNYLERQISRWGKQYQASITQPIPEMDALLAWLPAHIPASGRDDKACIVHGDYRLDNMIFHPTEPRVLAVLDWELSTLGHPLADFSYHCMVWHVEPSTQRGLEGLDLAALGIPSLDAYMAMYCENSGMSTPEVLRQDWSFYMAYNLFRLAAIAQGIAKRVEAGTASSAQAKAAGASAAPRARRAWQWAQQAQQAQQA